MLRGVSPFENLSIAGWQYLSLDHWKWISDALGNIAPEKREKISLISFIPFWRAWPLLFGIRGWATPSNGQTRVIVFPFLPAFRWVLNHELRHLTHPAKENPELIVDYYSRGTEKPGLLRWVRLEVFVAWGVTFFWQMGTLALFLSPHYLSFWFVLATLHLTSLSIGRLLPNNLWSKLKNWRDSSQWILDPQKRPVPTAYAATDREETIAEVYAHEQSQNPMFPIARDWIFIGLFSTGILFILLAAASQATDLLWQVSVEAVFFITEITIAVSIRKWFLKHGYGTFFGKPFDEKPSGLTVAIRQLFYSGSRIAHMIQSSATLMAILTLLFPFHLVAAMRQDGVLLKEGSQIVRGYFEARSTPRKTTPSSLTNESHDQKSSEATSSQQVGLIQKEWRQAFSSPITVRRPTSLSKKKDVRASFKPEEEISNITGTENVKQSPNEHEVTEVRTISRTMLPRGIPSVNAPTIGDWNIVRSQQLSDRKHIVAGNSMNEFNGSDYYLKWDDRMNRLEEYQPKTPEDFNNLDRDKNIWSARNLYAVIWTLPVDKKSRQVDPQMPLYIRGKSDRPGWIYIECTYVPCDRKNGSSYFATLSTSGPKLTQKLYISKAGPFEFKVPVSHKEDSKDLYIESVEISFGKMAATPSSEKVTVVNSRVTTYQSEGGGQKVPLNDDSRDPLTLSSLQAFYLENPKTTSFATRFVERGDGNSLTIQRVPYWTVRLLHRLLPRVALRRTARVVQAIASIFSSAVVEEFVHPWIAYGLSGTLQNMQAGQWRNLLRGKADLAGGDEWRVAWSQMSGLPLTVAMAIGLAGVLAALPQYHLLIGLFLWPTLLRALGDMIFLKDKNHEFRRGWRVIRQFRQDRNANEQPSENLGLPREKIIRQTPLSTRLRADDVPVRPDLTILDVPETDFGTAIAAEILSTSRFKDFLEYMKGKRTLSSPEDFDAMTALRKRLCDGIFRVAPTFEEPQLPSHVDVVIIGGGPAGLSTALHARALGMRVALFERGEVGETWTDPYMGNLSRMRTTPAQSALVQPGFSPPELLDLGLTEHFALFDQRGHEARRRWARLVHEGVGLSETARDIDDANADSMLDRPTWRSSVYQSLLTTALRLRAMGVLIAENTEVVESPKGSDGSFHIRLSDGRSISCDRVVDARGKVGALAENEKTVATFAALEGHHGVVFIGSYAQLREKFREVASVGNGPGPSCLIVSDTVLTEPTVLAAVRRLARRQNNDPGTDRAWVVGGGQGGGNAAVVLLNMGLKGHIFMEGPVFSVRQSLGKVAANLTLSWTALSNPEIAATLWRELINRFPAMTPAVLDFVADARRGKFSQVPMERNHYDVNIEWSQGVPELVIPSAWDLGRPPTGSMSLEELERRQSVKGPKSTYRLRNGVVVLAPGYWESRLPSEHPDVASVGFRRPTIPLETTIQGAALHAAHWAQEWYRELRGGQPDTSVSSPISVSWMGSTPIAANSDITVVKHKTAPLAMSQDGRFQIQYHRRKNEIVLVDQRDRRRKMVDVGIFGSREFAFHPHDETLVYWRDNWTDDRELRFLSLEDFTESRIRVDDSIRSQPPIWHPSGHWLAVATSHAVLIFDWEGGKSRLVRMLPVEMSDDCSMRWSPDGRYLFAIRGKVLRTWNTFDPSYAYLLLETTLPKPMGFLGEAVVLDDGYRLLGFFDPPKRRRLNYIIDVSPAGLVFLPQVIEGHLFGFLNPATLMGVSLEDKKFFLLRAKPGTLDRTPFSEKIMLAPSIPLKDQLLLNYFLSKLTWVAGRHLLVSQPSSHEDRRTLWYEMSVAPVRLSITFFPFNRHRSTRRTHAAA